ncbi:GTP cyclohydrolase I [Saccharopolyspora sp. ASAGF58]|uniref:GTP cyclohydrolase I n=1 Tax=Saccharopolyspora sp. ASAGF58 TaxID=2719023 RepID=UPI001FF095C8|nr:GTP cyclohydrolase I FolE [Saccharopolyspora sp. ASAGF58]
MLEAAPTEVQESKRPPTKLLPGSPVIDVDAAERAAAALLTAFGVPEGSEAAVRTPARMVAGLAELLTASPWEFTTFPNWEDQHELVLVRDVPFTSVCAHHVLPFSGTAQIGVLPGEKIAGLSKLARVVEMFAARMQIQEELGQQIAAFLEQELDCRGVAVMLSAEHVCMTRRGVRAYGSGTITIATRGRLRDDHTARSEFFQLVRPAAGRTA